MLKSMVGIILALSAAGICAAQSSQSTATAARHYRLTVVLANPQNQESSQRFVFDVPVTDDHPGQAEMNLTSGSTGQAEIGPKQTLQCTDVHASQCTDVHASAAGLAAKVSYTMDSVSPEPMPGSTEHMISHFVFEKQIDLPLASPTEITDMKSLRPIDGNRTKLPGPIEITVTATAL